MREYGWHYLILVAIFGLAVLGIIGFSSSQLATQIVVIGLVIAYILWGIGHHLIKKDLTVFIVLEYVLVGLLAGVVLAAVIFQK